LPLLTSPLSPCRQLDRQQWVDRPRVIKMGWTEKEDLVLVLQYGAASLARWLAGWLVQR